MILAITKSKIILFVGLTALFTLFLIVFSGSTAKAAITLSPTPGSHVPNYLANYLAACDSYGPSPAFVQWTTNSSGVPTGTFNVPYGFNGTLGIRAYSAGAVCKSNSAVLYSHFYVWDAVRASGSGTVSVASARTNILNFAPSYQSVGNYKDWHTNITYTPSSPMTTTQTIRIELEVRGMNYTSGNAYNCVLGPSGNKGGWNFWACNGQKYSVYITLNVAPPPDVCSNISGNQATVPSGHVRVGGRCYRNDAKPSLSGVAQCSSTRVRVTSNDSNGNGYNIQYRLNGSGGWTNVGRSGDGYFYVNLGSNGATSAVTVNLRTDGTRPGRVNPNTLQSASANVTYGPCLATISGTIVNANNFSHKYSGVSISTCGHGTPTTNASGRFSFNVPIGDTFCVQVSTPQTLAAGAVSRNVRPWSVGYTAACPGYNATTASPNYCAAEYRYLDQVAGQNTGSPDRSTDSGYDIALRTAPEISCSVQTGAFTEITDSYTPIVTVTNAGGSTNPLPSGTITVTVTGIGSSSTTYTNQATGTGTPYTLPNISVPVAGRYNVTANATASGDGINSSPNPVNCTGAFDLPVGNLPYLKAFGGDIFSGGQFDNETVAPGCTTPAADAGGVFGFSSSPAAGDYRGASSQFGINALLNIKGIYSASQRSSSTVSNTYRPLGLSIANTGSYSADDYGGYSGDSRCLPDYYTDTYDASLDAGGFPAGNAIPANRGRVQYRLPGDSTIGPLQINQGSQVAIYVDGDLFISNDITYSTGGRTDITHIPNLVIVARGNIKIAPTVTTLNGTFIAQPQDDGSDGKIYTCAPNLSVNYNASNVYANCRNPLTVYGSLVAKNVRFLRMNGTVGNAQANEYPPVNASNIAETIILTPESYLAPSPLKEPGAADGTTSNERWDAGRILPPVF